MGVAGSVLFSLRLRPGQGSTIDEPLGWLLEAQGDRLLCTDGKLNRQTGCLSDYQLKRIIRNGDKRMQEPDSPGLPHEAGELADQLHLRYLIEYGELTANQQTALRMKLEGYCLREIAEAEGRSQRAIRISLSSAYNRLRKAYQTAPLAGWNEVYKAETRRGR